MGIHKISTPRGTVTQYKSKNGKMMSKLTWNPEFAQKRTKNFNNAQEYIDSECLRLCDKLTPMRTKFLIRSGILGTRIGNGKLIYLAPYGRSVYYNKKAKFNGAPIRGPLWFERMKAQNRKNILKGAERIAGKN